MKETFEIRGWNGKPVFRTNNVDQAMAMANKCIPWTTAGGLKYDRPLYTVRVVPPTVVEAICEHVRQIFRLIVIWVRCRVGSNAKAERRAEEGGSQHH